MKKYTFTDFHFLYKEMDEIYDKIQKDYGIPDTEFWCLLAVRMGYAKYQHEISSIMRISKQTVNSALKQLYKKGYIELISAQNNLRRKEIKLTEKGYKFAVAFIDPVSELEDRAWSSISNEEQEQLIHIIKKLNQQLDHEVIDYINNRIKE